MLDWQNHKELRIFIKTISFVLIVSFLTYDLAWAGATEVLSPTKPRYSPQETQISSLIEIPRELGVIKDSFISKTNPSRLIIHIQDAHANVEAQENEARLIQYLKDKYRINLVSVEGGFGDFDGDFFRSFPKDKKVRDKIAKYFLSKAFISGADYLLITEEKPPVIYGAEDKGLYQRHLNTFKQNQESINSLSNSLSIMEEVIETLKNRYYSQDLKKLDVYINDFKQGRISLEEYLSYLNITSNNYNLSLSKFSNLLNLIKLQGLENKIDFEKAEDERQALIEVLPKALSKQDLEDLVKKSLDFKANRLTPYQYYSYLETQTKKLSIEPQNYPNFLSYIKYITLSKNLDNSKVFEEIDAFTKTLKEKLATTQTQKNIDSLTYIIKILKGLSNINLTPREYEYFKKNREQFSSKSIAQLLRRHKTSVITLLPKDEEISSLENFYDLAFERDKAIVTNSLNRLSQESNSHSVILVAGGFHTPGITSILKEKDISYLVIAPNIKTAQQDRETVYFSLLKDKKLPLEDVLNDPDTLQLVNSISDPQARQLLILYWVARASRYYSLRELKSQLKRLKLSEADRQAVQLALREIAPAPTSHKEGSKSESQPILTKIATLIPVLSLPYFGLIQDNYPISQLTSNLLDILTEPWVIFGILSIPVFYLPYRIIKTFISKAKESTTEIAPPITKQPSQRTEASQILTPEIQKSKEPELESNLSSSLQQENESQDNTLKVLGLPENIIPTVSQLIKAGFISQQEIVTIIQANIGKTNDISLGNYLLFVEIIRSAYERWLDNFSKSLGITLDDLVKDKILRKVIQDGESYIGKEESGLKFDAKGAPQIEIPEPQSKHNIVPLTDYVLRMIIESCIGGLNGRSTFVEYLLRQAKDMLNQNRSGGDILTMINLQHQFWSAILKDQLLKYDKVRDEKESLRQRPYLLINYEFDDLFRYCKDPVREFNLNLNQRLDSDVIQQLVMQFKIFLDKHRSHLPEIQYPISLAGFYLKAISFILMHWSKIFAKTKNETIKIKQAKVFWRNSVLIWLGLNVVVTTFAAMGISSVPGIFVVPFVVLAGILILSFLPISYRAIVYVGRAYVAWKEERINQIAVVRDWRGVRKRFDTLWLGLDAYQQNSYFRLIDNLYDEYKLTDSERMKLYRLNLKTATQNKEAQQRIKNWMNKFYQKDIPVVNSWQEVRSVTIQIASLDEKFFYHWDELISTCLEKGQIESILNYVKKIYPDEWRVLIDRLGDKLTRQEKQILRASISNVFTLENPQATREIEQWANFRLQTVLGTLENARKARLAYKNLAKKFFPSATDGELELLVSQKVQILFLHDMYPSYAVNSTQKQDIDNYLAIHPFIQLTWQENLIHQSKYGGWANALSKVTGEFLVTLDCDHSIRDEEIEFMPNALKEFTLNPNLTGIQFKVYAYNEPFSVITKSVGIAENSWWGLDLRVKDRLGATGLYGHLIFRTEFLKRFEGIQDDSVAEDILTSVRLLREGFDTKYIEYMRIGKGFNVTHAGMSIPYRRYPMGAIESGLSKPFMEFLLSDKVSWDKKAEALFMASYYPTQPFIILATIAYIVGAYLLPFNPYVFLPTIFFFLGLILAETINLGAILYMIENYGFVRGITEYLKTFPALTVFHVSFIPHYHERTEKALKGYAKFIVTRSSNVLTHESWETIYERNRFGFKLGAVLVPLILLTPFQGVVLFIASLLFILNSFIWLTAPFMLNPARNRIEKVKDVIIGPLWAFGVSYYEMSIGAISRYLLLSAIKRYLRDHKDLPVDKLDIRFQNLLKRAVGRRDINIIKGLWNIVEVLIKDTQGNNQKEKDTLKLVIERIDAVIKSRLDIEDLRKERLFENMASNSVDNKTVTTQVTRGPPHQPHYETEICLINLFSPTHPVLVRPLSIEVLAGDLYQVYGPRVKIKLFDLQVEEMDSIVKKIEEIKPQIIGLSVKVGSLEQAEEFLKKIKSLVILRDKSPLVVLGNVLPTFATEELLNRHKDVIIVIGEGEEAMRGLVKKAKEGNRDFSDVPNLAFVRSDEIIYTRRSVMDLNDIALPSYDTVPEIVRRGGHVWLEASRGCNGHCTFCSVRAMRHKGWEPLPVEKVIADVKFLVTQYKVKHLRFTDDDFMGTGSPEGMEHARKIAEGIKDLGITFDISTRVDALYSSRATPEENQQKLEIFKLLKEAGLTQVFLGIESGSVCQLKRYAKGISVEENKKGIQLFRELGIQVVMGFITIDYLMGLEELKENIEFLEETNVISEETSVFVSDPLSSLRAQEGCSYIKMLKNKGLLGPRDSSLVAYSASYKDARVGRIAYIIEEWRKETYPLVYALKNKASLASLTKEDSLERGLLEKYLYRFKQLDFTLLKELVQIMETMDELNIDKGKINSLLGDFRQRRLEIINSLLKEINQGRINDRDGILQKEAKAMVSKYRRPFNFVDALRMVIAILLPFNLTVFSTQILKAEDHKPQIEKFQNWLLINKDHSTGLPHSHVGDERFENWAITYDSAMVTLAYIAIGKLEEAKKIIDFYIDTPNAWRLGGIIEAVNPTSPVLGEDWSVRTGSNLWMGIASFHLYKATGENKYLDLAKKLADFAISLQNTDKEDSNFGGIRLGPLGGPNVAGDQHLSYDVRQSSFYEVFATEHNIDAYALFNMLYQETKEENYKETRDKALGWLRRVAYNKEEHRFNRGYKRGLDTAIATDIHSWGISALGVDVLDAFELDLAEKMAEFIEKNCLSEVPYTKPDGKKVKVRGVDFIDYKTAANLGRKPLVSPEWTFQLINAYRRLELDFKKRGDTQKETKYREKRQELTKSILDLAIELNDTLAYPYATQAEAIIGHEYNTPKENNLSAIGVSYAILALAGFDPLIYPSNQDTPSKNITLNSFIFLPLLISSIMFIQSESFINWLVGCLTIIVGAIVMFKNQFIPQKESILEDVNFNKKEQKAELNALSMVEEKSPVFKEKPTVALIEKEIPLIVNDFFAKALFSLTDDGGVVLNQQAILAINSLSATSNGLTLEVDVDTLIDTSKDIPQLKGIGFKEALASLYKAQEEKQIPENLRVRVININPKLNRTKIIKALCLNDELIKPLVVILDIPEDYLVKGLEPYLLDGSIRVVFEDNSRYWGQNIDILVQKGKEDEVLSSIGLIVVALAKEPGFYQGLPEELKEYITTKMDEGGNIKQLIFKPIERTRIDIRYLEQLERVNKELEDKV